MQALDVYRSEFTASRQLDRPYAMAGVNVFAAETDAEARRLFTSAQQQFTTLLRGKPGRLPPPVDDIDSYWTPAEKDYVSANLARSFVGTAEIIRSGVRRFLEATAVDEIIVVSSIYDHAARLRSYEMLADAFAPPVTPVSA
jgi:alkanesulfonate monooxygenase SsuD/methylene tetrahydromethanopterin reductase-like flavin-dependent oxidoreductase (luciferase family)